MSTLAADLDDDALVGAYASALHAYYLAPPGPALADLRADAEAYAGEIKRRLTVRFEPPF